MPHGNISQNASRRHWNQVWSSKSHSEVSWYQADPVPSLKAVDRIGVSASDVVIDVGCGESHLSEGLIHRGVGVLHLVDVSEVALDAVRTRLDSSEHAAEVHTHAIDVLELDPIPSVSLWHDRAALHFIRDPEARSRYSEIAARAVRPGGHLIIGGFAPDGPSRCSDLVVVRADLRDLAILFEGGFELSASHRESHSTPWGAEQPFQWCTFVRRGRRS